MAVVQSGSSSLVQDLAQALSRVERSVVRRLSRELDAEGCTIEQWRAMVLLADGNGHSMSAIAQFAFMPAPSLTRVVDRMVGDGLVHRTVDPSDRRRVLVHLTARGAALYRRLAARIEREHHHVLGAAEAQEAQRLLSSLSALFDEY